MGEVEEEPLNVIVEEAREEAKLPESTRVNNQSTSPKTINYKWWIRVSIYTFFLLISQTVALVLVRLYFMKGGSSKWVATMTQVAGFPILIPLYLITAHKNAATLEDQMEPPSALTLASVYLLLGKLVAANCFLYSIGLQYLPVSTYTLIAASQLGFNSFFSFFINSQKFTPLIVNSLVLLTISSILLVFNDKSTDPTGISKAKYTIGFTCTIAASALYGLTLSATQFSFRRIIKRQTFKAVLDVIIYQSLVATSMTLVGLFVSGDWNDLTTEMNAYQLGKLSYAIILVSSTLTWQISAICCVGLIFEVSSLFSNSISMVGLPIVPILAVFIFNDKMDGIKGISMVLAIWGFASYTYQHYLDDLNSKDQHRRNPNEVSLSG